MDLYQWQKDCLKAWEDHAYRGIVNVITGAGKTVFALEAEKRLRELYPDLKVRIVVPTIPLASQWKQALLRRAEDECDFPGFFGGTRKDPADRRYMIYIINSARTALSRHIRADLAVGSHVLLICDECHHYQSKENRKIFDFLNADVQESPLYCSLGLSATPFDNEENRAFLQRVLGKEIYRYDFIRAQQDGVISTFTVSQVAANFRAKERDAYDELSEELRLVLAKLLKACPKLRDLPEKEFMRKVTAMAKASNYDPSTLPAAFLLLCYQRKEISVMAETRIECCRDLIDRLPGQDRILIFCERIEQAEMTAITLRKRFGAGCCGIYHSKMTKEARTRNMALFREGQTRILVSCRCLDEGIDVPDANIGIVLSGSAVERQRIQRLGRIIRRAPEKDAACLYYIYIREAAEDRAFLHEIPESRSFDLQYDVREKDFSNDLYEYAANDLLYTAKAAGYNTAQMRELRRCLLLGLTRADYLLPESAQLQNIEAAEPKREKNYWNTMYRMGKYFETGEENNHHEL